MYCWSKKVAPPAYYDKYLKKTDELRYEKIKITRESSQLQSTPEQQPLVKIYEAKIIASKKVLRSLEGTPAHVPDEERLNYLLNQHNEYHYSLTGVKNAN